jgi:hypothetical protein
MTIHHATGVSSVAPSLFELSGRYKFRGFADWEPNHPRYRGLRSTVPDLEPDEEEAEHPSVIVARLREKIAAKSPAHAALVAAFLALPEPPPEGGPWEQVAPPVFTAPLARRKVGYLRLRRDGVDPAEAAERTGTPSRSRIRYESELRNPPCLCRHKAHKGRPCGHAGCGCTEYRTLGVTDD